MDTLELDEEKRLRGLFIYELNEVPERVFRTFISRYPKSALARLYRRGSLVKTITKDEGELHPWSTWPTFYRGVDNRTHKIRFINQDLTRANMLFPPVWEEIVKRGYKVGIFGSLQSYPAKKAKGYSFYLPDTFAPDSDAHPQDLKSFQSFNLRFAGKNKAVASRVSLRDVREFIRLLVGGFFQLRSSLLTLRHVCLELTSSKWKSRRSFVQAELGFGLYMKYLRRCNPEFSTFFTNHVAGSMHRYWRDLYPEDFRGERYEVDKFKEMTIMEGMLLADKQIGKLLCYADSVGAVVWIASSMGQSAIHRDEYIGELIICDWKRMIGALGLDADRIEFAPAMQPDICLKTDETSYISVVRKRVSSMVDFDGDRILKEVYEPVESSINLSINRSHCAIVHGQVVVSGERKTLEEIGMKVIKRDSGTGYHIPEGIIVSSEVERQEWLDTRDVREEILKRFKRL